MSIGVALLAALGPALGKAVYEVGKEVVAKPLMGPAAEQVEDAAPLTERQVLERLLGELDAERGEHLGRGSKEERLGID